MRGIFIKFFILIICCYVLEANNLQYSLIKKGTLDDNTVLVIGGIQGDEPGGFLAASLLATEYNITKGSLWVVPNLNFISIIKRDRGIYGDMNRKFDKIKENDPDLKSVNGIQSLIADKNVSMVLNLHDGSGFYRDHYINELENPKRWGNSCIIDQESLEGSKYTDLKGIALRVMDKINQNILDPKHKYHLKNTHTAKGDKEMLKSLTYFAIKNNKSAFANEASKTLPSHQRAYYHLLAIEEYLKVAGVEFERSFELNPQNVKEAIEKEIEVVLFDNKFYLSLNNPRAKIGYVPIPKNTALEYNSTNPLTALIEDKGAYVVHYGNKVLTKLIPEYFNYSDIESSVKIEVDGVLKEISLGSKINVKENIKVISRPNVRVNIIGYNSKLKDESDITVNKKDIIRNYSIDKKGKIFRIELYEQTDGANDKFIGMFLVEFAMLDLPNDGVLS
ncbi:MAG: M99 family carboxypeptidase catalytic domain-containing protein [Campylobacter hyointestinalis]|nr:M99 family carboxypeptidase catalytic domain-containing protein [Campylobacter hyointestinalis]MDY2999623.1 M99 family carboxypeptidase catalytic domain-containing protein [Campylobacter hyointestinalis]